MRLRRVTGPISNGDNSAVLISEAGWRDRPQTLCVTLTTVDDPVRDRTAVGDAVAGRHAVQPAVQLEVDDALEDEEQLVGVAVGIGLIAGRSIGLQTADQHLEILRP